MSLRSEMKADKSSELSNTLASLNRQINELSKDLSNIRLTHQNCPCCYSVRPEYKKSKEELDNTYLRRADCYLDLGLVNKAVIEFYDHFGYGEKQPFLLKLLTTLSSPTTHALDIGNLGFYKDRLYYWLKNCPDPVMRQQCFLQALSPNTILGTIFYTRRLDTEPSINRGFLGRIALTLSSELSNPKTPLHLDEFLLNEFSKNVDLRINLDKHFPIIFKRIMKAIQPPVAPVEAKQSEAKGSDLSFFKKVGEDGVVRNVSRWIALPHKEGGKELSLQIPRLIPNPEANNYDETGKPLKMRLGGR